MPTRFPKGSEWRRWDLHIHTPASALYHEFKSWDSYLDALEAANPQICALGITDYASIDGYRRIYKEKYENGRLPNFDLIVPNIEFRISPLTKHGSAINLHILVDPSDEKHVGWVEGALSRFTFEFKSQKHPCTGAGLTELGKAFDSSIKDDQAAFREGVNQFKPDFQTFRSWYEGEEWLKGNSLIAVSNSSNDGASGLQHDDGYKASRQEIYRISDIVFSGNPNDCSYFLGKGKDGPEQLAETINGPKPCIHGSDAHKEESLFQAYEGRYCWIKADPTFEGLRQILYEPETRVHIGKTIPEARDENRIVKSIRISNSNGWFADAELPINPALVSIIGSRGSGKTALADLIAYASGSWEQNPNSFIQKAHREIEGTKVTLNWVGGAADTREIGRRLEAGQERQVRYLSQQFVEQLCSEDKVGTELLREIEQVIFEHLDDTEKLGQTTFSDLRSAKTESVREQKTRLKAGIARLNEEIQALRKEVKSKPEKEQRIKELEKEKQGLEKQRPIFDSDTEQKVEEEIALLREERREVVAAISGHKLSLETIRSLRHRLSAFQDDMKDFFEGLKPDLEAVGIDSKEIENFRPGFKGDVESPLSGREKAIEIEIRVVTGADGDQYPEKKTLQAIDKKIVEQEQKSSQDLAKKQKSLEIQKRIATIDTEVNRLHNALEIIEREKRKLLLEKTQERWQRYLVYFDNLKLEQEILEALYGSLGQTLGSGSKEERSLEFYIKWKVDTAEWSSFGESLLDRRKQGPYRAPGEIAVKSKELLENAWTKGDKESVREGLQELRGTFDDTQGRYTLDSQLLSNNEAKFDDWLYSTEHITLTYGIKYDGIELENLTPGTKGIVLLILYLEMDKNDRRPLLIDQPEENLDNESVYKVLTSYFRRAKQRRQIILITHNPNLVVNTDSEQVIVASFVKTPPVGAAKIRYTTGSLEDSRIDAAGIDTGTREKVCQILEGGEIAFHMRERKYAFDRR